MAPVAKMRGRDVLIAALIAVGFVVFQVGANWTRGAGAVLAIFGLVVALGAVLTFIYDNVAKRRIDTETGTDVPQPAVSRFLFHDTRSAPLWLAVRFFLGFSWLESGLGKIMGSPSWLTSGAGLRGFWTNAAAIPKTGKPVITYDWYRNFVQYMLDHHWETGFAKVICLGEVLIGIGLIVGGLVGIAAFFGALMNMSFLLAGTASTNPVLFTLAILVILAWQVAGYWGADRFILPVLGAPWRPGLIARRTRSVPTGEPAHAPS